MKEPAPDLLKSINRLMGVSDFQRVVEWFRELGQDAIDRALAMRGEERAEACGVAAEWKGVLNSIDKSPDILTAQAADAAGAGQTDPDDE